MWLALATIVTAALLFALYMRGGRSWRAKNLLIDATQLVMDGRFEDAEETAVKAHQLDPSLGEALIVAAEAIQMSAKSRDDYLRATNYLNAIETNDPSVQFAAAKRIAVIEHQKLHRLEQAEVAYKRWLEFQPQDPDALTGYANLLSLCGRRELAVPYFLRLIQLGYASDFLMLLAKDSGMVGERGLLESAASGDEPSPLALLGLSRFTSEADNFNAAIGMLENAIEVAPDFVEAKVALGTSLADAGRFDSMWIWNDTLPASDAFTETWLARGKLADCHSDRPAAIRSYGEAVMRSPENRVANARLATLLSLENQPELADAFSKYVADLQSLNELQNRLFFARTAQDIGSLLELIDRYEKVGRFWEAFGWSQIAADIEPRNPLILQLLARLKNRVKDISPSRLADINSTPASLLQIDKYPLLELKGKSRRPSGTGLGDAYKDLAGSGKDNFSSPRFEENGLALGIDFRYFNGADVPERKMFEFPGGGVAISDIDQDGFPDLFFSQGRVWPPDSPADEYHDQWYRNVAGRGFLNVPQACQPSYDGFGQGATIGDFDADGFPDLYVANAGVNCLFRNNGDGTLSDVSEEVGISGSAWTTSVLMADLNGDTFPDIYDVNYVRGDDVFQRVCVGSDGQPIMCMPFDFEAEPDVVWINDGKGKFVDRSTFVLGPNEGGKGLGIVATSDASTGRLNLYVTNDLTPNAWWVPSENPDGPLFENQAMLNGLALNGSGKAEGSMGIAAGDLNDDAAIDFVVTNFLNESNSCYLSQSDGSYLDRTLATGLRELSMDVLGFGAQFLDVNLDGNMELFVANGHIDDLSRLGRPNQMPAQLFKFNQGKFEVFSADVAGEYFQGKWLGRAVAKIDWNCDGREDLVIGHLHDRSRVLTNVSEKVGHFISLRLIGVLADRDAIGTRVVVTSNGNSRYFQLAAGDGYQASNQRQLIIGLGAAEFASEVEIKWPSGTKTKFLVNKNDGIPLDTEVLVVEQREPVWQMSR